MTDFPTTIGVVTVQSNGGGVYELTADALTTSIKVRGEEKALLTAEQISGQIQAGLPPQAMDDEDDDGAEIVQSQQSEMDALRARIAELEAAGVTTAVPAAKHAAVDKHHARSAAIPGRLAKKMTDEQREALARVGVKTTRIMIDQTDDIPPSGLFVSHNGKSYMLQAGVELDCPDFLIDILNDAVMTAAITDPETHRVIGHRNRLRIPYRVIRTD